MNYRGLFVTIEGIDGSGKSLFAKRLAEILQRQGYPLLLVREPGGTALGEGLRGVLKSIEIKDPINQSLLFSASRRALVQEKIIPALTEGRVVVSDRFVDSMNVYQAAHQVSAPVLKFLNRLATENLSPDLTFWIKTNPQIAWQRVHQRGNPDQFDRTSVANFVEYERRFEELYKKHVHSWVLIDGEGGIEQNVSFAIKRIDQLLRERQLVVSGL